MGPWDRFVLALIPIVLILSVAGVIILRPLSKRLGEVLELLLEDRDVRHSVGIEEVHRRLEAIEDRLTRMEAPRPMLEEGGQGEAPSVGPGDANGERFAQGPD